MFGIDLENICQLMSSFFSNDLQTFGTFGHDSCTSPGNILHRNNVHYTEDVWPQNQNETASLIGRVGL